jgi:5-methyltetrahydropteroyltriglutamate--homocysteine methyltransferase
VPHNIDRILTTHVGSLIRPAKLIEFWRLIEDGEPYDEAAFEACLAESVTEVVRLQADVGIDIVSARGTKGPHGVDVGRSGPPSVS